MGQLVLFEHFRLDEGLHGVHLTVSFLLHQFDLTESTFADNLDGVVVFWLILCSQESQILALFSSSGGPKLLFSGGVLSRILELLLQFALSVFLLVLFFKSRLQYASHTFGYARGLS